MVNIPVYKIVCFCFFIILYFRYFFTTIFLSLIKLTICVILISVCCSICFSFFFVCLSIFFKFFFMGFIICLLICFLVSFPFFSHSFLLHMNILTVIIVNKRFGLFSNYIKVYIQFDNSSSAV